MRFDYHPPTTKFTSFHMRRLLLTYMVIIGLGCIAFTLISHNTNNHSDDPRENIYTQRPTLLSKSKHTSNSKATLNFTKKDSAATLKLDGQQVAAPTIVPKVANWQSVTVQIGDTLSKLFEQYGISRVTLKNLISSVKAAKELTNLKPGQKLNLLFDDDDSKTLKAVKLSLSDTKYLHVTQDGEKYKYSYEEETPLKKLNFSTAKISGSLYTAAQAAGLDDKLIMQMTDILGCDIDFTLDVRENDSFKVLYEEEFIADKKLQSSKILALEFSNQGKVYQAVRFQDDKGRDGYYSLDGYSLQKAFLRNPVEFTRISSHFSHGRRHPVLHKIRAHRGVDYAAPIGTPVKAAGDGKISFIGEKGGYGYAIEITHGNKYSTFYAHLSRFNKSIKHGTYVKQGQIIGYVGKTGLASGPHLHYEFRINGVHHNPITVALPSSNPIPAGRKEEFKGHAKNLFSMLDKHAGCER